MNATPEFVRLADGVLTGLLSISLLIIGAIVLLLGGGSLLSGAQYALKRWTAPTACAAAPRDAGPFRTPAEAATAMLLPITCSRCGAALRSATVRPRGDQGVFVRAFYGCGRETQELRR